MNSDEQTSIYLALETEVSRSEAKLIAAARVLEANFEEEATIRRKTVADFISLRKQKRERLRLAM
jgi:hypothetical protein